MTEDNINGNEINLTPTEEEVCNYRKKLMTFLMGILSFLILSAIVIIMTVPTMNYKPAIYLYSEKPTQVSIKLDKTIKYDITIPKYKKGWRVQTEQNGIIKDLQPKYTKCSKLPDTFGFEYAKKACEENKYPYIYWDGIELTKPIPKKDYGFLYKNPTTP